MTNPTRVEEAVERVRHWLKHSPCPGHQCEIAADLETLLAALPTDDDVETMMTKAITDIIAERQRQIEAEGWTPEHDDAHAHGEMAMAAACYAFGGTRAYAPTGHRSVNLWPWSAKWWKPTDRRRDLVKAGALIVAEIERLDRKP